MSYPKRCDKCDQFGEWCFCEPVPSPDTPDAPSYLPGDLFIPEIWATDAIDILRKNMVIAKFGKRKFDDDIGESLDRVRVGRGIS